MEREALAIVWATKHFRQYLEGGPVIFRSDCKALQWLKSTRYPILRGSPDSRDLGSIDYAVNLWASINILSDIQQQQLQDPRLSLIIQKLQQSPNSRVGDKRAPYTPINSILYKTRILNSYRDQRRFRLKYLIVIPASMHQSVLHWAHDHPTAGHAGRFKTMFRLTLHVYRPSMRRDVFKYVQSCNLCQQFRHKNTPTSAPMQMHVVSKPWHTIGVDIMGPFPETFRRKKYLLVIVDYFTRWVELFALRQTTAMDIVPILVNEIVCRYGIPTYILSDNDPQFIAQLFTELRTSL